MASWICCAQCLRFLGGEMIADVFLDHATYADLPNKFEAGTPAVGKIARGSGEPEWTGYEQYLCRRELTGYLFEQLQIPENRALFGPTLK